MAAGRRPSFLKRQKEQKRLERASAKRAARQARRAEKAERRAAEPEPDTEGATPAVEDTPAPEDSQD